MLQNYTCNICHALFSTAAGLTRHTGYHKRHPNDLRMRGAPVLSCQQCNRQFASARALTTHCRQAHPTIYQDMLSSRVAKSSVHWSAEEDAQSLLHAAHLGESVSSLAQLLPLLQTKLPFRTMTAIRKLPQFLKWKRPPGRRLHRHQPQQSLTPTTSATDNITEDTISNHSPKQNTPSFPVISLASKETASPTPENRSHRPSAPVAPSTGSASSRTSSSLSSASDSNKELEVLYTWKYFTRSQPAISHLRCRPGSPNNPLITNAPDFNPSNDPNAILYTPHSMHPPHSSRG
ncbi:unnamed protein product [Dicrocoelium dendriticum]|nr:unnamed protein product [Dicrocoelium dendriticum]